MTAIALGIPPTRRTPCQPKTGKGREDMARAVFNSFEDAGWDEHQIAELGRILIVVAQITLTDRLRNPPQPLVLRHPQPSPRIIEDDRRPCDVGDPA